MIILGAILLWLAWLLLLEYRKVFMSDPVALMSFEVLAAILKQGGSGYVAAVAALGDAFFVAAGMSILALMLSLLLGATLRPVWHALMLTLVH